MTKITIAQLSTHQVFSYSKSTMETPEQCSKFASKSTINSPEQRHGRYFAVYIIYREQISHIALAFLLMTLNK